MRRRRWPWVAAASAAIVAVVVLWFEPHTLWLDERVEERAPSASGPVVGGTFRSLDHETTGRAVVLERADGTKVLRLEDLATSNGPDLYVYLSPNPATGDEGAFDEGHLSLGRLRGNLGDQNYDLAAGADLARYRSVVIWCDRFDSAFGAADLRTL